MRYASKCHYLLGACVKLRRNDIIKTISWWSGVDNTIYGKNKKSSKYNCIAIFITNKGNEISTPPLLFLLKEAYSEKVVSLREILSFFSILYAKVVLLSDKFVGAS